MRNSILKFSLIIFVLLIFSLGSAVPAAREKRPLTHDDYDSWVTFSGEKLSDNGAWVLFIEAPQEGDASLVVKNISSGKEFRHVIGYTGEGTTAHRAARPEFSRSLGHVVFLISPTEDEIKAAKNKSRGASEDKDKKEDKPKKKLGIMSLGDGAVEVIEDVKEFKIPEKADWVAYLKEEPKKKEKPDKKEEAEKKPEPEIKAEPEKKLTPEEEKAKKKEEAKKDKKKDGAPLVYRSLKDGAEQVFELVLEYHVPKNGSFLFFMVSSKDTPEKDGLYAFTPGEETVPLLTGEGTYKGLAMDKEETRLAFLTDRDDFKADEPTFNVYGWMPGDKKATLWVSHTTTAGFPEGLAVSDKSAISFSEDGRVMLFGIKEIPEPEEDDEDTEEKAKFDLWHWNDPNPQPQQILMAKRVRDNTYECVLHLDSKTFVRLADEDLPDVELSWDGKIAWARNSWPYSKLVSWDSSYSDIYVVDPKTGKRTLVKKKLYGRASLSPGGKYIGWYEDGDWFAYNIAKNKTVNLTKDLDVRFDREDHDTPNPPYPHGYAGWTDSDASALIYDKYDVWEIKPDGSGARMITEGEGRKNNLSFRYVRLDREERTISPTKPIFLSAVNNETMGTGFYRDGVKGSSPPRKLLMMDKSILMFGKAKEADVVLIAPQSFDQFPDLFVTDLSFSKLRRLTEYGKQTEKFIWGKSELRDFSSSDGRPLKGILIKPENFDAAKKYPLMVYIYETLHQGIHRFRSPGPGTSINPSYYVSNGYILWMPDIEYGTGYPGQDALKCVLPGIQMLVGEGHINPKAIGIQGHSWGGYQISYMVTQTNIFAAAEAGAPVSNMVSAYGGIRWSSGMSREFQYERTQSRLGDSLWDVPMRYIENSPIFWADKVETPLLMIHNDKDGAVPWYQGIEYIMALRRLDKVAFMFNYNGEDHGLRKRVNQKDFTTRMQEFFDHYLKGTPAADWMVNGIKAWEKETK